MKTNYLQPYNTIGADQAPRISCKPIWQTIRSWQSNFSRQPYKLYSKDFAGGNN